VRKYMATGRDVDGEYRQRLFHAIRDLTADAYGGWRFVTNLQAGGGLYAQRIVTRKHLRLRRGEAARAGRGGVGRRRPLSDRDDGPTARCFASRSNGSRTSGSRPGLLRCGRPDRSRGPTPRRSAARASRRSLAICPLLGSVGQREE
jgi:hypothetical protein